MRILATNDDGILAPGLWTLVRELKKIAQVIVVAPDREQSARGTSVTLRQPLRAQKITPLVSQVEAYSVEGTPADSVILALGKLIEDDIDMVVSGINQGPNLGNDVLISGTVGAALQGYLRGFPTIAISVAAVDSQCLEIAARAAALLAAKLSSGELPADIFLNINIPDLPLEEIKAVQLTRLASKSHIDTVKEGFDGRQEYYWLVRQQLKMVADGETDIWAVEQGDISITTLNTELLNRSSPPLPQNLLTDLLREIKKTDNIDP